MTNRPHIIGLDLGKTWFHLIGLDRDGAIVLKQKLTRSLLSVFAATTPRTIIAMESCAGSQFWGRACTAGGHEVRLLPGRSRWTARSRRRRANSPRGPRTPRCASA